MNPHERSGGKLPFLAGCCQSISCQDDSGIVRAAADIGFLDERLGYVQKRRRRLKQDTPDVLIVDHFRQAIGTEEEEVVWGERMHGDFCLDMRFRTDGPRQYVSHRMTARL